jgi:hypothetical protein
VERIVRRDFPPELFERVINILNGSGAEMRQRQSPRVQLAVLKLANGSMEKLLYQTEAAKIDYRDVLCAAEYPSYSEKVFGIKSLPVEEQQRIIESDWEQYESWLKRDI